MNNRLLVLISIILAMLVTSMDSTITNTTMPVIARELGGFELFAWSFSAYMIMSTVLYPVAGRLSDLYGRKKVFSVGIVLFLIGSLLCGASNTMLQLVLYRAVQGIGAGVMMPFPAIIAGDLFPIEQRGKIQAFFTAMWGISAVVAPLLGAFFVQFATWRWIFYVNIPIGLISLVLLFFYKEHYVSKRSSVDYIGAILFTVGVSLLLTITVVHNNQILLAGLGIVFLLLFILNERKHPSPIVPLNLLKNKPVTLMIVNSFLVCAALFGAFSYIPLFLQREGYSLFLSGVALLGTSFGWMLVSVPAGKWIVRFGYGPLLIIGNVLLVLAGALFLAIGKGSGFSFVFFITIILGLAFGLVTTVSIIGSQQLVEAHQKGISTSLQLFSRNIGTAIGVTIMGAFLTQAKDFIVGIHALFTYGFVISLFALMSSLFLRNVKESGSQKVAQK